MACITKLSTAINYDCESGATGFVSALIINKSDIESFSYGAYNEINSFVLKDGAVAYKIDTVKRSLVMSDSLKVNEGAPNAFTHTATLTVAQDRHQGAWANLSNAITNGSFVILTMPRAYVEGSSPVSVYGLYYGMSATSVERSSHDNGTWATIVMSTPENVIGEDTMVLKKTIYDALYEAAVG